MRSPRLALLALLAPVAIAAQAAPPYRGFTPGISYRAFIERARALADSDVARCQTSPRAAQVMEGGVVVRDPGDRARFYLSAHFVDGNADVVALYDSAGSGDARGRARGGAAPPSRAPGRAPATAPLVPVSPPAAARKISASSRAGRRNAHQNAISTQCTTYPYSPCTATGKSRSCSQGTRWIASSRGRGAAPSKRCSTSSTKCRLPCSSSRAARFTATDPQVQRSSACVMAACCAETRTSRSALA